MTEQQPAPAPAPPARGVVGWLLADRTTGKLVIAQVPNAALWLFIGFRFAAWVLGAQSDLGRGLGNLGTAALVWWALDELLRGVNPFRRMLGAVVLALQVAALL